MPATAKQLSYLKALAIQRGQTFTYPHTPQQASREIQRLKRIRADSRADQRGDRHAIADAIHAGITGYGSTATWVQNRTPRPTEDIGPPALSATVSSDRRPAGRTGLLHRGR
jgi:hypothetical protein